MGLSIAEKIRRQIEDISSGGVITLETFTDKWSRNVVARVLSRLAKDGYIVRLKRGVYSKEKETRFGKVSSTPLEIVAEQLSHDENKCFGGLFLFNNLGLTTQVPNVIEVLNNKSSYCSKVGATTIRYVRIRPQINKETKKFISILEVIKNSKTIPDSSIQKTHDWIFEKIKEQSAKGIIELTKISLEYPPRVRAILGCMFYNQKKVKEAMRLKETLNVNSVYRVGQMSLVMHGADEWGIVK
jgi:hypothetical protein